MSRGTQSPVTRHQQVCPARGQHPGRFEADTGDRTGHRRGPAAQVEPGRNPFRRRVFVKSARGCRVTTVDSV